MPSAATIRWGSALAELSVDVYLVGNERNCGVDRLYVDAPTHRSFCGRSEELNLLCALWHPHPGHDHAFAGTIRRSALLHAHPDHAETVRRLFAAFDFIIVVWSRYSVDAPDEVLSQHFARPVHLPSDWQPDLSSSAAIPVYHLEPPTHAPLLDGTTEVSEASLAPPIGLAAFPAVELFRRLISAFPSIRACLLPLRRQGPPARRSPGLPAWAWARTSAQAA